MRPVVIIGFLFLLAQHPLFAQSPGQAQQQGDDLTLKVAVIGPGDELYFWWGHIGLVIEDSSSNTSRFFDWGAFSFENENFFVNFAFGRLLYSCIVTSADIVYYYYILTNRDITLYTLDLPADVKEEILRFADNNMLPENRDYMYHHFRDNCATRIRDIIDMAIDGQFREFYGEAPGRYTLRQHVRRHTWFNLFFDWILNFWMGQDIDRPITVWDEMFLPSEIASRIEDFHYTGEDGKYRSLVSSIEVLSKSTGRPQVLETPRLQWPIELAASLAFSFIVVIAFFVFRKFKYFRPSIGIIQALIGLFFGIAGTMLAFFTLFSDHDYTFHNSNVFFVNPLFLLAIPLGLIYGFSKSEKKQSVSLRLLAFFWAYVFLGGLLTMALKLFPAFYQQNQVTQALVMPIALTMFFVNINFNLSVFKKTAGP